ncbi:MAG: glycosyltransferase [Nitrospira sp.]|nr:glycosyltransferase [Nitrospira sp.]
MTSLKQRIAYLTSEYPAISHTFIFREIQALRAMGLQVMTASIKRPAFLSKMTTEEKHETEETLYIKDLPIIEIILAHINILIKSPAKYLSMLSEAITLSRSGPRNVLKGLAYFAEAGILLNWMFRNAINHIHVHFANPAATVAMIASSYGNITYSMSVHGPDVFYNVDPLLLAEKAKKALFVRCISHYCQSQLMRLLPTAMWSKLDIVRCGIDPEIFTPSDKIADNIPEILCVGRLVPAKGQHILLQACGRLKDRGAKFHMTFIGEGEDRDSLEALTKKLGLSSNVIFTGALGQEAVRSHYDRANIFVLASFAEGLPVVLMEAMSKSIPSVSTRITGIPELIDNWKDGVLVSPSDVAGLTDALQTLLSDPELRKVLGKAARQKVMQQYSLKQNCELMANLFKKHLNI